MRAAFHLTVALALVSQASSFFTAGPVRSSRAVQSTIMMGGRAATPLGRGSTKEGKAVKVAAMKEHLERSMLIFAVPSVGLSVPQMGALREKMPESTTVSVCKNTLIELATAGTEWEAVSDYTTLENMWFFVGEDGLGDTLKGYEAWLKECGKTEKDIDIKGGVFEGTTQDTAATRAILKLPSKQELMGKIAGAIQQAGAQGIAVRLKKAAGGKLAIALKMAADKEDGPFSKE